MSLRRHGARKGLFGHIQGTMGTSHSDELPGLHGRTRHERDIERAERRARWAARAAHEHGDAWDPDTDPASQPRYRPSLRHGLEDQALICSFRFTEENRAIREFVVNAVTTSREVAAWVSRLGLPVNSIQDKLPYHREAMSGAPGTIIVSHDLRRFEAAHKDGSLYRTDLPRRPRPVFKVDSPGIGATIAANLALIGVLFTIRV